jgi:hypothetical protein
MDKRADTFVMQLDRRRGLRDRLVGRKFAGFDPALEFGER